MASSEIKSLDDIQYSSKVKIYFIGITVFFLFVVAFMNTFPVGEKLKSVIKDQTKGTGCNPNYDTLSFEWIMPKLVISDLKLPARCLEKTGDPITFRYVNLNWNLINFWPVGIPFRLDTEVQGQKIEVYYVQGIGEKLIRLKKQKLNLARLQQFMGNFKMSGLMEVDLKAHLGKEELKEFELDATSEDFVIPAQSIEGFSLGQQKLNTFSMKARSEGGNTITVEDLHMGDEGSPIRATFKGKIDLNQKELSQSVLNLNGEITFTEDFKNSFPVDLVFSKFTQKDGFYQIKLSGTLGAPQLVNP